MSFLLILMYLRQAPPSDWPPNIDATGLPPAVANYFAGENTLSAESVQSCLDWLENYPFTGKNLLDVLAAVCNYHVFEIVAPWLFCHGLSAVFGRDWIHAAIATKNPAALRFVLDKQYAGIIDFNRELTSILLLNGGEWACMAPMSPYYPAYFHPGMDSDTQHNYYRYVLYSGCLATLNRLCAPTLHGPINELVSAAVAGGLNSVKHLKARFHGISMKDFLKNMVVFNLEVVVWCVWYGFDTCSSFGHSVIHPLMDVAARFPKNAAACISLVKFTKLYNDMFIAAVSCDNVPLLNLLADMTQIPHRHDVLEAMMLESVCHSPAVTNWIFSNLASPISYIITMRKTGRTSLGMSILWRVIDEEKFVFAADSSSNRNIMFACQLKVLHRRKFRWNFVVNTALLILHGIRCARTLRMLKTQQELPAPVAPARRPRLPPELWAMIVHDYMPKN